MKALLGPWGKIHVGVGVHRFVHIQLVVLVCVYRTYMYMYVNLCLHCVEQSGSPGTLTAKDHKHDKKNKQKDLYRDRDRDRPPVEHLRSSDPPPGYSPHTPTHHSGQRVAAGLHCAARRVYYKSSEMYRCRCVRVCDRQLHWLMVVVVWVAGLIPVNPPMIPSHHQQQFDIPQFQHMHLDYASQQSAQHQQQVYFSS